MKKHIIASIAVLATFGTAHAQNYPDRPPTMVIPFAAGGPQDQIGRVVAQRMGELMGYQIVVENVGGAGGMTGSARVMQAAPDGYNMILGSVGTHAQNQTLYKKPLYDAAVDFTPVALVAETPIALITRKDLPATNMKEFAEYAKANASKMSYGSAGVGSATHLGCVVLNHELGVNITHVPYRGSSPAASDMMGGRIDYMCDIINTAKPQIDGGTLKGIALMTKERSPALPNLPTTTEQGYPTILAYTWSAIYLPKNTPPAIVKKLNDYIIQAMNTPAVKATLANVGAQVVSNDRATPDYLAQFTKDEIATWAVPIKASGATVE